MAALKPAHVVAPSHIGQGARADTSDYLLHLRLTGSDQLSRRNAMQVFAEMEFE